MSIIEKDLVFLSYASEDLERVSKIYEGLKNRKLNVWFDKKDMKTEKSLETIERTIAHSKAFVFCLSNAALKKTRLENPGFLDKELRIAWDFARDLVEKDFRFVVVRLEDCERGDLRLKTGIKSIYFQTLIKVLTY
jgi:hypothetical protein